MPQLRIWIFVQVCALLSAPWAFAAPVKSAAGLELGGNGTLLLSDPTLQAFGVGAGFQGSVFFSAWRDRPIGAKLRIETLSLNEVSVQKAPTEYVQAGTSLKSMTQKWTAFSVGAEGHFEGHGQIFFWEALIGYAMGAPSTVTVTTGAADQPVIDLPQTTRTGIAVSGGIGIKRVFTPLLSGVMSVRTFYLIGSAYTTEPFVHKAFIPLPLMFSVGAEYSFDFLR
jgi:hypothetical protein